MIDFDRAYELRRTWLKRRLREEGLTHTEFARMVGIHRHTVRRIINGQHNPSREMMRRLYEALEINP